MRRSWYREPRALVAGVLAGGVVLGVLVTVKPALAIAAVGVVLVALGGLLSPAVLMGMIYSGILLDRLGSTGIAITGVPVTLSKLSVLAGLGMWVVHSVFAQRSLVRWHPVLTGLSLLVATMAVSHAHAGPTPRGFPELAGVLMLTVLALLVPSALAGADLQRLYRYMGLLLAGALVASLLNLVHVSHVAGTPRGTGLMGDPNEWGAVIVLLTPIIIGGLADDEHWTARPLLFALLLFVPLGVLQTASRAALMVGILVMGGCVWMLRRYKGMIGLAALSALLTAPLVLDLEVAVKRYTALLIAAQGESLAQDGSLSERNELRHQAIDLFHDHWFVGVGPGNFGRASGYVPLEGNLQGAHNSYLQIAAEDGLLGLCALGVVALLMAGTFYVSVRYAADRRAANRVVGVAGGLGALALMSATLGLVTLSIGWFMLGFGLAVSTQARHPVARVSGSG